MNQPGRIAAVVLAAGASSRMGSPKPLLPIAESNYLEHLLAKLGGVGVEPVVVVLGCRAAEVRARTDTGDAVLVENDLWEQGMLSSIQAAVLMLRQRPQVEAMMVLPVDQPRVAVSTMCSVVEAWAAVRAPVTVPTYQGRRGHPVVFDRSTWSDLLVAPADEGARSVVRDCGAAVESVPVDDSWVLMDADTPAEHETMRRGAATSTAGR